MRLARRMLTLFRLPSFEERRAAVELQLLHAKEMLTSMVTGPNSIFDVLSVFIWDGKVKILHRFLKYSESCIERSSSGSVLETCLSGIYFEGSSS
jgi:hypothetical protein